MELVSMFLLESYKANLELFRNSKKSYSELKTIQEKKLRKLIRFAYETVPYYHNLFKTNNIDPESIRTVADLKKIPITTKEDLLKAGDSWLSNAVDKKSCKYIRTGGSTAKVLTFYKSHYNISRHRASFLRARMENGVNPIFCNKLQLYTPRYVDKSETPADYYLRLSKPPEILNVMDYTPADLKASFENRKYHWISGYPSIFKLLSQKILSGELKPPETQHLFSSSEVLDSHTRGIVSRAFGTDLRDIYGSYENGCIAWECEKHEGYHINIDMLVPEVFNDDEASDIGTGRLILTNLSSFDMPFIRYDQKDIVTLTDDTCSCGRPFPLLKSITGRMDDFIKTPSGKLIDPIGFRLIIITSELNSSIMEYQAIQNSIDSVDVNLILNDQSKMPAIEKELLEKFQRFMGEDMNISIHSVDNVERTQAGRMRCVISRLGN